MILFIGKNDSQVASDMNISEKQKVKKNSEYF